MSGKVSGRQTHNYRMLALPVGEAICRETREYKRLVVTRRGDGKLLRAQRLLYHNDGVRLQTSTNSWPRRYLRANTLSSKESFLSREQQLDFSSIPTREQKAEPAELPPEIRRDLRLSSDYNSCSLHSFPIESLGRRRSVARTFDWPGEGGGQLIDRPWASLFLPVG